MANEVLGNGDASIAFQSFKLSKAPVTFVPQANAPHGAGSTLKLYVNGVRWDEAPTFYGHAGNEQIYTTAIDDAGKLTVRGGDGQTGARLPTGRGNLVATYRQGLGQIGNVRAGALTTLLDRPLGLKSVSNPQPANGGADAETLEQARENAPNTVRTFGRMVSLRDFEDGAREYAGIAKARATWDWIGSEMSVRLVVAGDHGATVSGTTLQDLRQYLDARRDPNRRLRIESYRPIGVEIEVVVRVNPRYVLDEVKAAAQAALQNYFAFDHLALGQPINLSNISATLQAVAGAVFVDINRLTFQNIAAMSLQEWQQRRLSFRLVGTSCLVDPVQGRLLLKPEELAFLQSLTLNPALAEGVIP